MAKNGAKSGGRIGSASGRIKFRNSKTGFSIKRDGTFVSDGIVVRRDGTAGRFSDIKRSGGAFKGVRREG